MKVKSVTDDSKTSNELTYHYLGNNIIRLDRRILRSKEMYALVNVGIRGTYLDYISKDNLGIFGDIMVDTTKLFIYDICVDRLASKDFGNHEGIIRDVVEEHYRGNLSLCKIDTLRQKIIKEFIDGDIRQVYKTRTSKNTI